jgi:dihydrofolate reductase
LNTLPKLVFSNTLSEAPWGTWHPARIVRGDAVSEIRRLKEKDGKHMVLWGSLSLAQDLIAADLIDEYHLQICPTIVGAGRRLFPGLSGYERLKRANVRTYDTGVVFLHSEPQATGVAYRLGFPGSSERASSERRRTSAAQSGAASIWHKSSHGP